MAFEGAYNKAVNAKYGYCIYNKNDVYIGRSIEAYGEFSGLESEIFGEFCTNGSVAIEVGANIGVHTQALSRVVGERGIVLAFEPQRLSFQTLCANLAINSITNVFAYNLAVSQSASEILVPELDYSKQNNFGGISLENVQKGIRISAIPLDSLQSQLRKVDFIKIDVEGMEQEVLLGAKEILALHKPVLYIENDRQEKSQKLIELLWNLGYTLYWHLPPLFNPNNFFKNPKNIFGNTISVNMVCLHKHHNFDLKKYGLKEVLESSTHPLAKNTPAKSAEERCRAGELFAKKGAYQEAVNAYQEAIKIDPLHKKSYLYFGALLKHLKKYEDAVQLYNIALRHFPDDDNFHNLVGIVFEMMGRDNKAIEAYKNAIRVNPKSSKSINNLGVMLYKQKRYEESAKIFQIALDVDPDYTEVYSNLGAALNKAKKYEESIQALERAIEKMPNHAGAYTNLGNVYSKLGDYKKAQKLHEKSIELEPKGSNAYSNLATALKNQGLTQKAIENYKKAIALDSQFVNAHFDLSTALLSIGEFEEGLKEYEWRFKKDEMLPHIIKYKEIFSKPMLQKGSDAKGKKVLVHSEQGFGDSLMFVRFIPELKQRFGCEVIFKARDELVDLFEGSCDIDRVVYRSEPTPNFDYHLPIMSIAYVLDLKDEKDFTKKDYLSIKKFNELTIEKNNKKHNIGICWSASPTGESFEGKVFDLKFFEPLIMNEKLNIYSLQAGYGREDIKKYGYEHKIIDRMDSVENFAQTAYLASQMDLIITSDTSVAHLCGGLGLETWTLLQKYPDWRWKNKGEESYLYPSMTLIRQKHDKNWVNVFQSVQDRVKKRFKV